MFTCENFRAGHTYAQVAPYAKQVNNICTPMFCQYGTFNTGKTTLLSALSALHGIQNGKVQRKYLVHRTEMNILPVWAINMAEINENFS